MSDPSNEKPKPPGPPLDSSDSNSQKEPSSADNELDIEADALLDSLLAERESDTEALALDDEEITGVIRPVPVAAPVTNEADEFTDVGDSLISEPPPPVDPLSAGPPPIVKSPEVSSQGTLLGMRAAKLPHSKGMLPPRPSILRPQSFGVTQKPPAVNPAGPSLREPFLPTNSPKAPPVKVSSPVREDDTPLEVMEPELAQSDSSRPSTHGLADELEPTDRLDDGAAEVPGFEDVDEDILESVPPEPVRDGSYDDFDSVPPSELESFPPDSILPSSKKPFHSSSRLTEDTLLDDERTELLHSLTDEALGTYGSERSAVEHLTDQAKLEQWRSRAEWFEGQAASLADSAAKARALLMASEHFAQLGDFQKARLVASEAHAAQPTMTMGARQARWLAACQQDFKAVAGALDLETRASPTSIARAHAATFAADVHRVCLDDVSNARRKLDLAARVQPADPRPYILRLAEQLGQSGGPARLRWPEVEELASLGQVADELEQLRGAKADAKTPSHAVTFEEVRRSLSNQDMEAAVSALSRLSKARGMERAALWLGAVLAAPREQTRPAAIEMLRELIENHKSTLARHALAARALEQADADGVRTAVYDGAELSPAFDAANRIALATLTPTVLSVQPMDLVELASGPLQPLAAAATAANAPTGAPLQLICGSAQQRDEILLARAIATVLSPETPGADHSSSEPGDDGADQTPLARLRKASERLAKKHGHTPITEVLTLEFALGERNVAAVADAIFRWPGLENGPAKALASALLLEVAGEVERAKQQFTKVVELDPNHEAATRALLAEAPPLQAAELLANLADASDDPTQAGFLLLEAALLRRDDAKASEELLVQAAASAPDLPLIYLQGEQQARQRGDAEMLLSWLRQRRENATDSIEKAFDYVREALLVAENNMDLAASLLADAVSARPSDVALQELHERLAAQAAVERGTWREAAAEALNQDDRQRLLTEAALEYERAGDMTSAARVARLAARGNPSPLTTLTAERLEIALGNTAALSESLLKAARAENDGPAQRELYERLSDLDEQKGDHSSALLWQSAILERTPNYLPALRRLEQEYITRARWDDLEPIALELARELGDQAAEARAVWVGQQRILSGRWDSAHEAVELACTRERPGLWALRAFAGQARGTDNVEATLRVELDLMERAAGPLDTATLALRAAEASTRLGKLKEARALLQRAIQQVPNHLVALTTLADVLDAMGDALAAAEALEAAASAYQLTKHQVDSWYQAAVLWQDSVKDEQRAVHALEAALDRDITHSEAFRRLQDIYIARREAQKIAELLERRLAATDDPEQRIAIEVMRGQALAGVGDKQAAKEALAAALDASPEHTDALAAFAGLCLQEGDFAGAEQAWIRLVRHLGDPAEQVAVYSKLAGLYQEQLPNPERAELAYQEVLKRDPDNAAAMQRLVEVYVALHDEPRAVALAEQLIAKAGSEAERRDHTLGLARVYERVSQDPKQALAILEAAKKTYGNDSQVLRAHAQLLQRRGEDRAVSMLLDRAANDARRALTTGRFDTRFFETLAAVSELRGSADGALIAQATLSALRSEPSEIVGAGPRAADRQLDDLLAPAALSGSVRSLLQKAGHVLDAAYPVDLKPLRVVPLSERAPQLQSHVEQVAAAFGIDHVEAYSSAALGPICMPVSSTPARLVYGDSLLSNENDVARFFLLIRALKIMQLGATTLCRTAPIDLWPLVAGFLGIFAETWEPPGADARKADQAKQRIRAAMPEQLDSDVPILALEVIGAIGNRASQLGVATNQFGNRAGLVAVGNPSAALEGVALAVGQDKGLPSEPSERLKWIVRNSEARDLAVFSVSDQYLQARAALELQGL